MAPIPCGARPVSGRVHQLSAGTVAVVRFPRDISGRKSRGAQLHRHCGGPHYRSGHLPWHGQWVESCCSRGCGGNSVSSHLYSYVLFSYCISCGCGLGCDQ